MNEFILEFEQKYNACTKKGKKYPDDILAMKIIDKCNLSAMDQKLVLSVYQVSIIRRKMNYLSLQRNL